VHNVLVRPGVMFPMARLDVGHGSIIEPSHWLPGAAGQI